MTAGARIILGAAIDSGNTVRERAAGRHGSPHRHVRYQRGGLGAARRAGAGAANTLQPTYRSYSGGVRWLLPHDCHGRHQSATASSASNGSH